MKKLFFIAVIAVYCCAFHFPSSWKNGGIDSLKNNEDSVYYTPHEMPCSFHIISQTNYTSPEVYQGEEHLVLNSPNYLKVIEKYATNETVALYRPDIQKDMNGYNHYCISTNTRIEGSSEVQCSLNWTGGFNVAAFMFELDVSYIVPVAYDNVTEGTFMGKDVKIYYKINQDQEQTWIYVDSENYTIGEKFESDEESYVRSYTYNLNADLSEFVLNKEDFPSCNLALFDPPKSGDCRK